MEEFFTRQKANEGVKLPLFLPDGTATEHYLVVRGIDSDHWRQADAESKRMLARAFKTDEDLKKLDDKAMAHLIDESRMMVLTALIAGWSFDDECSPENVRKLLTEAPQIADEIDKFAARRTRFFGIGRVSSTTSPAQSSNLPSRRKIRKSRSNPV